MRYSNDPSKIGTKLGPKLVALISQTIVHTKRQLLHTEHRARVTSIQEIIDRAGREIADLHRPMIDKLLLDESIPDDVRTYLHNIKSGRRQWQALAGFAFAGSGASNALSTIISNFLAPSVRADVKLAPQLLPPPETLIQLGVKGAMDWPDVYDASHGQGYADWVIDSLRIGSYAWPDLSTTLELLRRNVININDARLYMTRGGINPEIQDKLLSLQDVILSPADLADMVVRGIKTEADARTTALQSGVSAEDFDALVKDTGEPLALMQLLEAYRRRFIDEARLVHGIRQSRIRDEWVDVATKLRFAPMSVADAVNATVQNHMDAGTMNRIAEENGLEPGNADILLETAGEPLSRTEMEQLYDRGLVTEEEVKQALRESRLKNKYIDAAFALHTKVLPIYTLQRALRYGGVSHHDAIRITMENGYSERDANIVVNAGSAEKIQAYRNRVVSAIESMYEDNTIPEIEALDMIKGLGFEDTESKFIIQSAGFRRSARFATQVTTAVRTRYVSRRIDRVAASNDLDRFGIVATQRDQLLGLWDFEREANVRSLTEAQIVRAVKKMTLTPEDGLTRLKALGYSEGDATILLKDA